MSKFAAIEARATQYPASVNDVVWLVEQVRKLRDALDDLVCAGENASEERLAAMAVLEALEEPNLPVD